MERALKQRLTGAIVLVILGVVFIPVFLDGAGHHARFSKEIEIPESPEIKVESWDELRAIPAKPPEQQSRSIASASSEPAQAEPREQVTTKTTRKPSISAWALQLGSFNKQTNALVMRDKLRAKGYRAYVETIKNRSEISYKVRVGPELDRTRLEKVQIKLEKEEKIKSIVVSHP